MENELDKVPLASRPPSWTEVILAAIGSFLSCLFVPFFLFYVAASGLNEIWGPETPIEGWLLRLAASVCAIGVILLLALFVVKQLFKIGNTKADVTASLKKAGITITVKGAGLFGAFLALVLWGLVAIYYLMKLK